MYIDLYLRRREAKIHHHGDRMVAVVITDSYQGFFLVVQSRLIHVTRSSRYLSELTSQKQVRKSEISQNDPLLDPRYLLGQRKRGKAIYALASAWMHLRGSVWGCQTHRKDFADVR